MGDSTPVWIYIIIPVLSALVGYGTNVAAVGMTFYPIKFWPFRIWQPEGQPFGFIGWQGIIPSKAIVMAELLCEVFITKVLDISAIFGRIDPQHVARLTQKQMQDSIAQVVDKVGRTHAPDIWLALSPNAKQELQLLVSAEAIDYIQDLLTALQKNILDVVDLKHLVGRLVAADRGILNSIFLDVGASEFAFIKRSGFYFGFLFGLLQTLAYVFYKGVWVLPVAGFLVGYLTNWVALKLIFEPAQPINLRVYILQGIFLKRQQEASVAMAAICKLHFLDQAVLWNEIFQGVRHKEWEALLARTTEAFVLRQARADVTRRVASALFLGADGLQGVWTQVTEHINMALPSILPVTYDYIDKVMDVETTMREALQAMPPADFINILRPVFKQDELKLILVGGVLGAAAGALQQFAVFNFVL